MQENVARKERMETEERVYTIKDIEALPEGERAELIESAQAREFSHLGFLQADGSFDMLYGSQLEVIDLEPYLESLSEGEKRWPSVSIRPASV